MKAPSPPPTPDPYKLSNAQQLASISVAVASMVLQNADEDTEEYTTGFTEIGTYSLDDPQYDSSGNLTGTTTRDIPRFKKTFALKPTMKALWDQEQAYKANLNEFAIAQTDDMATRFSSSFNLTGISAAGTAPTAPYLASSSNDYATERERVRQAMLDRLEYQIGIDLDALEAKLANQGIFSGTTAWEREMRAHTNKTTDARIQVDIAAGEEASRMIRDTVTLLEFGNSVNMRRYQVLRDLADFATTLRERAIQERVLERNQVLNEVSAIMHGGQINMPAMTPIKSQGIANTDMASIVMQSAQMDMAKWQQKVQQQNAMMGGIAGIAGSLMGMPMGNNMSFGGAVASKMLSG